MCPRPGRPSPLSPFFSPLEQRLAHWVIADALQATRDFDEAIKEAETAGKRVLPEYGAGHYGLQGKDQASARAHVTIAVPNATAASMKIPDKPSTSGIWLMDAGTTGTDRPVADGCDCRTAAGGRAPIGAIALGSIVTVIVARRRRNVGRR